MNLPPLQAEARLRSDIKAVKTIAITIATYFVCYFPAIVYAVGGSQKTGNLNEAWIGFILSCSLYISSTVNPVIYYLRTSRFRSAFKQFLKDPFGSSDFKEKPIGRRQEEKRRTEGMGRKKDAEKADGEKEAREIEFDGDQPRQTYSGQQRNEMILSIANLQSDACLLQAGESRECKRLAQRPWEMQGEQTEKGNEELVEGGVLGNESRKRKPSEKKIHPLQITNLEINEVPAEKKREVSVNGRQGKTESNLSLGRRRNAMKSVQGFQNVLKEAWGEKNIDDRREDVKGKGQDEEEQE